MNIETEIMYGLKDEQFFDDILKYDFKNKSFFFFDILYKL